MSNYAAIFTPTAVEIIRDLASQGRSATEIADVLGSTPGSVRVKCCQFKIKLQRNRHRLTGDCDPPIHRLVTHINPSIYRNLQQRARLKQKTVAELAEMLIEAVVSSDIYAAVLDGNS